jgi:TatD DNase family protein
MLIDTHCHLDFPEFDKDRSEVIERARDNRIDYIVNIGSSLENSKRSLELSQNFDFIYAAIGCHPHEADRFNEDIKIALEKLAGQEKVVAIGEIGLDYFKNYSKKENQKKLFITLLKLSRQLALPVIIHCREAQNDILEILKEHPPTKVVVHCFSGEEWFLNECLDRGFFVSFTCNITYKNAHTLRELVKKTPLDRLFLETDAPFLPPQDFRGRRCEPIYVRQLAQEISKLKETSFDNVARITTENAKNFFNLR